MTTDKIERAIVLSKPDEIEAFRLIVIRGALKLMKLGMRPNRHWKPKSTLSAVSKETGKVYKGKNKYDEAIRDLTVLIEGE